VSNIGIPGEHVIELQEQDDFPVRKKRRRDFPVIKPVSRISGHDFPVRIETVKITLLIAFGGVSVVGLSLALLWALFFHPTALMPMALCMFGIFYMASALVTRNF
jgi:hypothetical protein